MKLGKRNCVECGEEFNKVQPLQYLCSWGCLNTYRRKAQKVKNDKEWKERKKVLKKQTTTHSQYKKKLEYQVNKLVRLIDYGNTCMMCDKAISWNKEVKELIPNACHYHAVNSNDTLRFNLFNIWGGCYQCNGHKGGNNTGYDTQLIQKVGRANWEYVKFTLVKDYPLIKLSKDELINLIEKVKEINKKVKPTRRSTRERWKLREKLNNKIGIY